MKSAGKGGNSSSLAFIEPCLAQLTNEPPTGDNWVHEIKYDGYRIQAHIEHGRVTLLTRNAHDWTEKFGVVGQEFAEIGVRSAIIDGEAIVQDATGVSDFDALAREISKARSAIIVFMAFDLMYLDGSELRSRPLLERKAALKRVLGSRADGALLRFSDHMKGDGCEILSQACKLRLEGIVSKRADRPYRSGRSGDWLKSKCLMVDLFVVIGYVGSTATSEAIGSLVLGYYEGKSLVYAGRVGTGFSFRDAASIWQALKPLHSKPPPLARELTRDQRDGVEWVEPRLVAQVKYTAWTDENILRHATFKGLRDDKPALEIGRPASLP
jgi:bifunctional non-homologous end joining protein LigD